MSNHTGAPIETAMIDSSKPATFASQPLGGAGVTVAATPPHIDLNGNCGSPHQPTGSGTLCTAAATSPVVAPDFSTLAETVLAIAARSVESPHSTRAIRIVSTFANRTM